MLINLYYVQNVIKKKHLPVHFYLTLTIRLIKMI